MRSYIGTELAYLMVERAIRKCYDTLKTRKDAIPLKEG